MSLIFSFEIGSPATAELVASAFVELAASQGVIPEDTTVDRLTGEGVATRHQLWCRLGEQQPSPFPWPRPVEESFGVVATCWVTFQPSPSLGSVRLQQDEMVWLVAGVLARLPGDAVLHWDSEMAWLVRKGGRLVVSDRDDIWTAERLAMLPRPYERAALAFADG